MRRNSETGGTQAAGAQEGIGNLETDTPAGTNSIFQLASLTKPFTAAAIMMLVEEGRVSSG